MPTLNKRKSDNGSYVYWSPHSSVGTRTYQVSDRAAGLFSRLEYSVTSHEDKEEIISDVCRALRILGDLHFKDESPDSVDTSDLRAISGMFGVDLSADQKRKFREYIEDHPRYSGETRQLLSGAIRSLRENSDETHSGSTELEEARKAAEQAATRDEEREIRETVRQQYERSPEIKQYAHLRAGGQCEACETNAPFRSIVGRPYLEVHHVDELGNSGFDAPENVVALCPKCHAQVHYGEAGEELNNRVRKKLKTEIEPDK